MADASPVIRSANPLPDSAFTARHRLMVLAADAVDVIASAGGLLFDRVGAGWDVQVYLDEPDTGSGARALQILGIKTCMPSPQFDPARWPDFLLVGADLYRRNIFVRRLFGTAARRSRTEVAIWGGDWPTELERGIGPVQHRLSTAALAFKAHALRAVDLTPDVSGAEYFRNGKRRFDIAAAMLPPA